MAENSKIEWTDHTFNPWVGCTKVSPACDHCYAESWAKRTGSPKLWQGERRCTTAAYWRQPLKWDAAARTAGKRAKVFCASLADVFDNQVPNDWRADLWALIAATPNLDWLLLTKRPQNIAKMLPESFNLPLWPWLNVWLGTTAENQKEADRRTMHLLNLPARVHFLSCEPLLAPLWTMTPWLTGGSTATGTRENGIDWVICGGESDAAARPMHPDWALSLGDQCAAAGVPFFFKQWGEYEPNDTGHALSGNPVPGSGGTFRTARFPHGSLMNRVGKNAAGALLDGREWREMPDV